jgi:molecular chaperone GrpE
MSEKNENDILDENHENNKKSDNDLESQKELIESLKLQLEEENNKVSSYEKKIQYLLADFENLKKRSEMEIQTRLTTIIDKIILKFLVIYDDLSRAIDILLEQGTNTEGLDSILKNMKTILIEFEVKPIEAIGEIFDPKIHEAISIKEDPSLDDNTIIAELRKGYILKDRVIRPSLVEISKRNIKEMNIND